MILEMLMNRNQNTLYKVNVIPKINEKQRPLFLIFLK